MTKTEQIVSEIMKVLHEKTATIAKNEYKEVTVRTSEHGSTTNYNIQSADGP